MSNDNAKKILESVFDKFEIRGAELYIFKQAVKRVLKENEEKSKIIYLMSKHFTGSAIFDIDKDESLILSDKEEVKKYFENKVKEVK